MAGSEPGNITRTDLHDPDLGVGQPRFQTVGGSLLIRVHFPRACIQFAVSGLAYRHGLIFDEQ
jgi:hypothetical protein